MTLKTCLRCDWEGDGKDAACPSCGVPLYVVVAPPTRVAVPAKNDPEERTPEAIGSEPRASDDVSGRPDPPPAPPDTAGSPGRPTRTVGVSLMVVLALTIGASTWLSSREGRSSPALPTGPVEQPSTGGDPPTPVASSPAAASGNLIDVRPVRRALVAGGIPFSFRVRTAGWESFAEAGSQPGPRTTVSINKSIIGPQGAEAIVFWSTFPDGAIAQPCRILSDRVVGPSAADLADAVATAPGIELVAGPSDVMVGGRASKRVELLVTDRRGCDPGFFYTWRDVPWGALWPRTPLRTTIRVWIVDVDGTLIFIGAATNKQADAGLVREIEQIVRSIRFDT